jgi:hypothetical protein
MAFDTFTLIWLFPLAFLLHDLEELLFFEPWVKKNAGAIMGKVRGRLPGFLEKQLEAILHKSTAQFAFPIVLIFLLTCLAAFLAARYGQYPLFLMAGSLFFVHGFMHIGQAIIMKKYIPALITSLVIVIPYGMVLFWNLLESKITTLSALLAYCIIGAAIAIPFILGMHAIGESLHKYLSEVTSQ